MDKNLESYFELDEVCTWINNNNFKKVALQFPDDLLQQSFDISEYIKIHTDSQPYVLADTPYASCCIDSIAAQHINSDALVHFGSACLFAAPPNNLPVYYAFGNDTFSRSNKDFREEIDQDTFLQKFIEALSYVLDYYNDIQLFDLDNSNTQQFFQILLFYEFNYWKYLKKVMTVIEEMLVNMIENNKICTNFKAQELRHPHLVINFIVTQPFFPTSPLKSIPNNDYTIECSRIVPQPSITNTEHSIVKNNIQINFYDFKSHNYTIETKDHESVILTNATILPDKQSKTCIVFLGNSDSPTFTRIFFHYYPRHYQPEGVGKIDSFYVYDPTSQPKSTMVHQDANINATLARRFHYIEKGKEAKIIGIITGILSDGRTMDVVNRLKKMIKEAGKKSYTFLFGKLNPHKLANFGEIDAYVLVACPQTSLIPLEKARDFYRPIITPWELEMACNSLQNPDACSSIFGPFSQRINLDYGTLYCSNDHTEPSSLNGNGERCKDDENLKNEANDLGSDIGDGGKSLQVKDPLNVGVYTSHDYYSKLSWKGLELGDLNEPAAKITQGRTGIASLYISELNS